MARAELICMLLVHIATVTAMFNIDEFVIFSGEKVTLKCPPLEGTSDIKWFKGNPAKEQTLTDEMYVIKNYSDDNEGEYHCTRGSKTAHFYIKGHVCETCYELDGLIVSLCIAGDLLMTGGVVLLVSLCFRKNAGPAPSKRSGQPAISGGHQRRSNAAANQDYQGVSEATRSRDVYATPVHRTG